MCWKKKRFSVLFLLFAGLQANVLAQDSYNLKQLIDEALYNNYQIKLAKISEKQTSNSNTLGNAGLLPSVDALVNNSTSFNSSDQKFFTGESKTSSDARNMNFDAMVELNWVVFNGFRMFAQKRQLQYLETAGAVNTRFFVEQTVADLSKAYFQLKQEQNLLQALKASLRISNERLKLEEQKFKIGAGSGLDVQKALVDRNSDSSTVVYQQAQIGAIILGINRMINRDLSLNFIGEDTLSINDALEIEPLLENALRLNSQKQLAGIQELIAREDVLISRSRFYPEVGLFGNYTYREATNQIGVLESNKTFGPSFGLQVRLNLFNGGADKMDLKNSRLDLDYAQLETAQLTQRIKIGVQTAFLNYKTGLNGLLLEESNKNVAGETLKIAKRQYELRVISDIEFRLIQLSALQAETNYLRQQFIVKNLEIDLLRMSGQLLNNI